MPASTTSLTDRRCSRSARIALLAALAMLMPCAGFSGAAPAPNAAPVTPRSAAALDLTGEWVSVITEDWKFRMASPVIGAAEGIPLNNEGKRLAGLWDAQKDIAAGEQCRAYGAANIMRQPTRLRIGWEDDDTLRIDTDAGTQTRRLEFGAVDAQPPLSWQGLSRAQWQRPAVRSEPGTGGSLKVVTTRLKPGYLRKNGVPYSEETVLTEYYDRFAAPNGDSWLVITQEVTDPKYMTRPYITSANFKKIPNGAGWNPTPCSAN
ncbi:MAG: hypothetical protein LBE59_02985 [Nevskiaceae bacterium]|nr:hypothetical protein [Nevskiaceae bacterium]